MFNNCGSKIKIIAIVSFLLNMITFFVVSIWLCGIFDKTLNADFGVLILIFLLIMIVGLLVSWASSLLIYGFGSLVENSETISDILLGHYTDSDDYFQPPKNIDKEDI